MLGDAVFLSRIQFAANISFHILFPTLTIALGWILFFFKMRFRATKDKKWMDSYFFWTKIFALCFALGVVTGITMSFQFGTNWPGFMKTVGDIAGPLLGYEVMTAFFLEATFLGIMLFGFRRLSAFVHDLATFFVAFGTTLSSFWILSLNSWMQTPAGFKMEGGKAIPTDWFAIIFNPSMPYRMSHMLLASGLTAAFFVAGIAAYRLLRGDTSESARVSLKTGLYLAAFLAPLQIFMGDMHGLNTLAHQPQKVAAMEGLWETQKGAPLVLFALPDGQERKNHMALEIPKLSSFILTHTWDGEVRGLNDFLDAHPPVAPVFWAFRIMVGLGCLMIAVAWGGAGWLWRKASLPPLILRVLCIMTGAGWVATLAGWYVTEIGRSPYLVSGVLKIADAASQVPPSKIGFTLLLYIAVYIMLFTAFVGTLIHMARKEVKTA